MSIFVPVSLMPGGGGGGIGRGGGPGGGPGGFGILPSDMCSCTPPHATCSGLFKPRAAPLYEARFKVWFEKATRNVATNRSHSTSPAR